MVGLIYIKKGATPEALIQYKKTPGADFNGMPKDEVRQALLIEQGYLCAYCMQRLNSDGTETKIEHYYPRKPVNDEDGGETARRKELEYSNMLLVCRGNGSGGSGKGNTDSRHFTCDAKKENQFLHINPQSKENMETIFYDPQGKIHSNNTNYQQDLDEILNLNDPYGYLVENRKSALEELWKKVASKTKEGESAEALFEKYRDKFCQLDADGKLLEYVGILRWYVDKKLKSYQ